MATFREVLALPGLDVRAAVLDDLATYHGITPEEARRRCVGWEELSLAEWQATGNAADPGKDDEDARVRFYRSMQSWSYDLLWWAYIQSAGLAEPAAVIALRWLEHNAPGRDHLDLGSGAGTTSQLFLARGWNSTLADLSSTLLDFARFRLERRGAQAGYVDLHAGSLPAGAFDVVTAIDTLAHVPDIHRTGRELHAALRPGGLLVANLDIRKPAPETAWHLYDDDLRARHDLHRAGFRPIARLRYGLVVYRRVDDAGVARLVRTAGDWFRLASPPRRLARRIGHPLLRTVAAVRRSRRVRAQRAGAASGGPRSEP
jgi:SAM-dependent methyltransferase